MKNFALITIFLCACAGADGHDGANGHDGLRGTQGEKGEVGPMGPQGVPGTDGDDSATPQLITESVFCESFTADTNPAWRHITYKQARFYDGSVFLSVSCDTINDQDTESDIFSVDQVGASTDGAGMMCALLDETGAVIVIQFKPNFEGRTLQVTEDGIVAINQNFDTDCTVAAAD